jgi:hypothetical protein
MLNVDRYIRYEEWVAGAKPNKNHLDPDATFNGTLFQHAPAELEYLTQAVPHQLWTLYEENEVLSIRNGLLQDLPGRLGYFHTKLSYDTSRVFVVKDLPSSSL